MKLWHKYYIPSTVAEALQLLEQHNGSALIIAGGTDLLVDMRAEEQQPIEALIDITRIPELRGIYADSDYVYIGAAVTHTEIVNSELLVANATCLVESCGVIGGPQVRNVGTLGGNVAHALPAGDGTTSLVALDAEAEIVFDGKQQWLPILDLYKGAGYSLINSAKDVILRFRFRKSMANRASAFKRIMRPQGVALPILGCAVHVSLDESYETYTDVRICIAPVATTPQRISSVEDVLKGRPVSSEIIDAAIEIAQNTIKPRTSKYRATADYRTEMIAVLLKQTLQLATHRVQTGRVVPEGVGYKEVL